MKILKKRDLLGSLNLLNLILVCLLIFFMNFMTSPFSKMKTRPAPPPVKKPALQNVSTKENVEEKLPSPMDYMVIAENNVFHPERIIPSPKVEAAPLPKPDFVLYGTLVTGDIKIAYMDEKKVKGPQQKKQTAMKLGDSMSGFVLTKVDSDKVVMRRGEEEIVVSLNTVKQRETPAQPAVAQGVPGAQTPSAAQVPGAAVQQAPGTAAEGSQAIRSKPGQRANVASRRTTRRATQYPEQTDQ